MPEPDLKTAAAAAHQAPAAGPFVLEVDAVAKRYGGVQALGGVSLSVQPGTVHAIVGENGAGKSTLMKIIAGVVAPDTGSLRLDGRTVMWSGPLEASRAGIGIVFQELSTLPTRDALANLFINREISRFGVVSRGAMAAKARPVLADLGLDVDLDGPVGGLPVADRQLLEIARVVIAGPRIILLDEPNSALNQRETERLFGIVRRLCARGVTVIYVSHRLEEVFAISDTISVMRNGAMIWTRPKEACSIPDVIEGMLGRGSGELFPPAPESTDFDGPSLRVEGLNVSGGAKDVSFEVLPGQMTGIAGLDGSGAESLLPALFGGRRSDCAHIAFPDGKRAPTSPHEAAGRGIALVPADRRREGLTLKQSIAVNASHVAIGSNGRWWQPVTDALMRARASRVIRNLAVRAPSPDVDVGKLSGGNQQKIVVGKWLETSPDVVLLDDPTRGIDVGAKQELFSLVRGLQAEGKIILMRSTELAELLGMCSQVMIFYRNRLAGIVDAHTLDPNGLLEAINTGRIP